MKAATLKKAFQIFGIFTILITSTFMTKNVIKNIKHLYNIELTRNGTICFFDMIQ